MDTQKEIVMHKLKLSITTGEEAKMLRLKLNMNQTQFWGKLGVTQSGGSRYESERNVPRPVQILLNLAYGTEKRAQDLLVSLRARD